MNKKIISAICCMGMTVGMVGCSGSTDVTTTVTTTTTTTAGAETETETQEAANVQLTALDYMEKYNSGLTENIIDDKYRNYYEVFLYSYCDSDGDGIGDINGLISKLDYINDGNPETDTDLGMTGIWLMPVMPSPSYHKYDVTDYYGIDSEYGTLDDFKNLLTECHKRGIRVIIDLVLNHTSSEHPWFTEATDYLKTLGEDEEPDASVCPYVDYYEFSREQSQDFYEVTGTDWYYRGDFAYTMPDLNLDNQEVRDNISDIADYWLDMGVDGFRLDAVLYYYEQNTEKNVEFLSWFNDICKTKNPDSYIVGECWTDASTYEQYYASGIDSLFDFEFSNAEGNIVKAVKRSGKYKSAAAYGERLKSLQEELSAYENAIDAPFFTNHDMGRGAGYFYSPGNSYCWTKMGQALNLLMNGNTFTYYGEELGMSGSGDDENKRAPMLWSADSEAAGMCDGPAGWSAVSNYPAEDEQDTDGDSILNFIRQVVKLRNAYPEIARGEIEVCDCSGDDIVIMKKTYEGESIYVAINLSKEAATVDISGEDWYQAGAEIGGAAFTTAEDISLSDGTLTMPRDSIVIFK